MVIEYKFCRCDCNVALQIRGPNTKQGGPSSIPGTHMMEGCGV